MPLEPDWFPFQGVFWVPEISSHAVKTAIVCGGRFSSVGSVLCGRWYAAVGLRSSRWQLKRWIRPPYSSSYSTINWVVATTSWMTWLCPLFRPDMETSEENSPVSTPIKRQWRRRGKEMSPCLCDLLEGLQASFFLISLVGYFPCP